VKYEKHHGVRLTPAGKMRALEVLRHHRLLERFLHDCLGYSWDEVHDDAERWSTSYPSVSRTALQQTRRSADRPARASHPGTKRRLASAAGGLLSKWACGVKAVISSVSDRDPSALREMERLGLKTRGGDHG